MTVGDWLRCRSPRPPQALLDRVLAALQDDAGAPESELPEACLRAAERTLESLIDGRRFGRESAIDLLAVDALMTWAYEHAAGTRSRAQLESLAAHGALTLGQLADHG